VSNLRRPCTDTPTPDTLETKAIDEAVDCFRARRGAFKVKVTKGSNGSHPSIGPHPDDATGWNVRFRNTFGTASRDFVASALDGLIKNTADKTGIDEVALNAALAIVDGVRPRDEIEAMLASQMAVTHSLAMQLLARTKRAEHLPQFESAGNLAVKLLRTYTAQVEALSKLRRGGEQTVRVEHVHVYPGGQAVVGNVNNHREGGGLSERGGQPRAAGNPRTLVFAPGPPVRSADSKREGVHVSRGEGQEAVPHARGRKG
jgi:hypothetical protein